MTERVELEPWTVVGRRQVLALPPRLTVTVETVVLPDGRRLDDFVQLAMPSFAVIFAEARDGRLVCLRQYKHGPRRVGLTLPAGHLEPGEAPLEAARRELLEETGYRCRDWLSMGRFTNAGNQGCGECFAFKARGGEQIQPPQPGDLEDMRLELLTREEAAEAMRRGEFAIMGSVAALALGLGPLFPWPAG